VVDIFVCGLQILDLFISIFFFFFFVAGWLQIKRERNGYGQVRCGPCGVLNFE